LIGIYLTRGFKFEFYWVDKLRLAVLKAFVFLMKFIPIICILVFSGCKTVQQKADRHIQKAIELDPEVIKRIKTKTLVRDTIRFKTEINLPPIDFKKKFDFDAFLSDLKRDSAFSIIDTLGTEITATIKQDGAIQFDLNQTWVPIKIDTNLIYAKEHELDGAQIQIRVKYPIWSYIEFWVLLLYSCFITYIVLRK
jgi:hypothetical protein